MTGNDWAQPWHHHDEVVALPVIRPGKDQEEKSDFEEQGSKQKAAQQVYPRASACERR